MKPIINQWDKQTDHYKRKDLPPTQQQLRQMAVLDAALDFGHYVYIEGVGDMEIMYNGVRQYWLDDMEECHEDS